jgi:Transcriptional regulators
MLTEKDRRTLQIFHRAAVPLDRAMQVADRRSGCSGAQLQALSAIIFFKATTLSALAEHERIAVPTASRIVESLVQAGLVARTPLPGDRRATQLVATPRGRAALTAACDARVEVLEGVLADLTREEWAALAVTARALNRVFGLDGGGRYVARVESPAEAETA